MLEFFIVRTGGAFVLMLDDEQVGVFDSEHSAADLAVRFSQETGATGWRIFYP